MSKFLDWCDRHYVTIALFLGIVNIISGLIDIFSGNPWWGLFWVAIGSFLVFDAKTRKDENDRFL